MRLVRRKTHHNETGGWKAGTWGQDQAGYEQEAGNGEILTTKSVSRQADNADNIETPKPMRSLHRQADNDPSSWQ